MAFPEAGNRPFLRSHGPKLENMAIFEPVPSKGDRLSSDHEAFSRVGGGVTSLKMHRDCWEGYIQTPVRTQKKGWILGGPVSGVGMMCLGGGGR